MGNCLRPVFSRLKRAGAQIKAIAMDISQAYRKAAKTYAPEAILVHDPFHVVQSVNKALDQVRRDEQARLEKKTRRLSKATAFSS